MIKLEKRDSVDQLTHPALALLAARPEQFTFQGSVDATWRHRNGRTFGPYYRLRYRSGGRSCSIYLGRPSPLVDRVRETLHNLQKPLREHRALTALGRQIREALRQDRRRVDAHLRRLGLHLKGFEVRGWRTSPVRWLARLTPTHRSAFTPFRIQPFRLPSVHRLRFVPRGLGLQWFHDQHPRAPRSPQDRVIAVIEWRKQQKAREKRARAIRDSRAASAWMSGVAHRDTPLQTRRSGTPCLTPFHGMPFAR